MQSSAIWTLKFGKTTGFHYGQRSKKIWTTKDCWCLAKIIVSLDDQHCSILLAEFNVYTQSKTFFSLTKNLSYFRRKLSIVSLFKHSIYGLQKVLIDIKFSKVILPVIWCWNKLISNICHVQFASHLLVNEGIQSLLPNKCPILSRSWKLMGQMPHFQHRPWKGVSSHGLGHLGHIRERIKIL